MPRTDIKPKGLFNSVVCITQLPRHSFDPLQTDSRYKLWLYGEAEPRYSRDGRRKVVPKLIGGRLLSLLSRCESVIGRISFHANFSCSSTVPRSFRGMHAIVGF
jgi:hypothetical protein